MSVVKTSKIMHPDAESGGLELSPDGSISFDGEDALATESYVDTQVSAATTGLATESYVSSEIAGATTGLATETFVNEKIAEADPLGLILALGG
jgi:hypothetical protein